VLPKPAAPRKPRASKTTAPKKRKVSCPDHCLWVPGALLGVNTARRSVHLHRTARDAPQAGAARLQVKEEAADLKDEADDNAEAEAEVRSLEAVCFTTA
jgi:hypothetical protein